MLVLSREAQQCVAVGGCEGFEHLLKVVVLEIRGNTVKLGFEIDGQVPVHRWEVWERILAAGAADPSEFHAPEPISSLHEPKPGLTV